MPREFNEDLPCPRRSPGQEIHWIQARLSAQAPTEEPVTVVVGGESDLIVTGEVESLLYFHHDTDRLEDALLGATGTVTLRPQGVLAVPGENGRTLLFSLATERRWSPCDPREQREPSQDPLF